MDLIPLKASTRERTGKAAMNGVRKEGYVPAVLYGLKQEPVKLRINTRELIKLFHRDQGEHAIVDLQVEDNPDVSCPAMFKEVQHHPVRGDLMHADLVRIDLTQKLETWVQTRLEGQAIGVVEGGVLDHQRREVQIRCLPTAVPEYLAADISNLKIGESLHVSDLVVPEGVEVLTSGERALAAIHPPRVLKKALATEAGVEPEEIGEEAAEAAEGAAEGGEGGGEEGGGE